MTKSGQVKHGDLCLAIQAAKPGTGLRLATCANSQLTVSSSCTDSIWALYQSSVSRFPRNSLAEHKIVVRLASGLTWLSGEISKPLKCARAACSSSSALKFDSCALVDLKTRRGAMKKQARSPALNMGKRLFRLTFLHGLQRALLVFQTFFHSKADLPQ